MGRVRVDRAVAERLAVSECGWSPADGELVEITAGFGNHNWRVPRPDGDLVLKIGPSASAGKWAAAQRGAVRAGPAGLVVPELLTTRLVGEHVVRSLRWVDGESARALVDEPEAQARLGRDLGEAIGALHAEELDGYASRLDGMSRTFPSWDGYVSDRLSAIERRALAAEAPEPALFSRAASDAREMAADVAGECRPVVCHRDLHPDNLIVAPDGSLRGIVDWDMAEAWDAAGEWFKLELFLFERLPAARAPFESAYTALAEPISADRRRVVLLVESLNVVANADRFADDFVDFGIKTLQTLT